MSRRILAISDGYDSRSYGHESRSPEPVPRKRKSRWSAATETDRTFIPGMPTQLPPNLTAKQEKIYILQLQVEDLSRRLKCGDLGIPKNPMDRSPSPEPIYSSEGKRMNTREYRTRKRMEEDRHNLIQQMLELNPEYKPPSDYKAPQNKITDKVFIPQDNHPDINFVGLLIGPRGNTLKALEKDTGAKVIIRGKGSVKEGKVGRRDGMPMPGEDEPLHAFVSAPAAEAVQKAVKKITEIIRQGIEIPEAQNDLRRAQLRELALLNGTLREHEGLIKLRAMAEAQTIATNKIQCGLCGGAGHLSTDCKVNLAAMGYGDQMNINPEERSKMDSEYSALMMELGVGAAGLSGMGRLSGLRPTRIPRQPPPPGVAPTEEEDDDVGSSNLNGNTTTVVSNTPVPPTSAVTSYPYPLPPPPAIPGAPYPPMAPPVCSWPGQPPMCPPMGSYGQGGQGYPPAAGPGTYGMIAPSAWPPAAPSQIGGWGDPSMAYGGPGMVPAPYWGGGGGMYPQPIPNPPPPPPPPGV